MALKRSLWQKAPAHQESQLRASMQCQHMTRPAISESTRTTVQRSWQQLRGWGTSAVADLIPAYLFQISPDLKNLFPPQVREKYREWTAEEGVAESERSLYDSPGLRNIFVNIVNTTGQAVAGLHDLGQLIPMLRQLGTRHVGYGVQEEHLPAMGKAIILSLRSCFGDSFSDEAEYAWTTAFGFISAILVEAMRAHQPAMSLLHLVNEGKEDK
mmetsp:Transcript_5276/g.10729  ORF Transcript_5276/g.10729 Transcript_5276/m.10729 type:complete len:213 (-) Transcript_5276:530-1168(-)